jgi:hypothetical protein
MYTISVVAHVDRWPRNDVGTGEDAWLCFSINLSAGIDFSQVGPGELADHSRDLYEAVGRHLRPWLWAVNALKVVMVDSKKGTAEQLKEAVRVDQLPDGKPVRQAIGALVTDAQKQAWFVVLEARLEKLRVRQNDSYVVYKDTFSFPVVNASGTNIGKPTNYEYNEDDPARAKPATRAATHRWVMEVMDMSTAPAPLPHAANLTHFFWIKRKVLANYDYVAALPAVAFRVGDAERIPKWKPDTTPDWLNSAKSAPRRINPEDNRSVLIWEYEAKEPAVPVVGYVNVAPVSLAEVNDGWVALEKGLYGEDWLAELEPRLANLFDLPRLVLEYLAALAANLTPESVAGGASRLASPNAEAPVIAVAAAVAESVAQVEKAARELLPFLKATLRDLVQTGAGCGRRLMPGEWRLDREIETSLAGDVIRELLRVRGRMDDQEKADFLMGARAALAKLELWERDVGAVRSWWNEVLGRIWKAAGRGVDAVTDAQDAAPAEVPGYNVLRAWYARLTEEEHVRSLVLEQWDKALDVAASAVGVGVATAGALAGSDVGAAGAAHVAGSVIASSWWQSYRLTVRDKVLPALAIRKRLALMHLGVQWTQILPAARAGIGGDQEALAGSIAKQLFALEAGPPATVTGALARYVEDRMQLALDGRVFDDLPMSEAAVSPEVRFGFYIWLAGYVNLAVRAAVGQFAATGSAATAGSTQPDAIVVQAAPATSAGPDASDEDVSDEMRRLSGVGVLAWNEKSDRPLCLSLARVCAPGGIETLAQLTVVPSRLVYRNDLRRCLISYENEPLSSRSPAGALARNHALQDQQALDYPEWLHFANVYGRESHTPAPAEPSPKLPALRFGATYNVAAFQVGVVGNLPRSLCVEQFFPVALKPRLAANDLLNPIEEPYYVRHRYLRGVAVGPLRLESDARAARAAPGTSADSKGPGQLGDRLDLPAIPAGVRPLTRSLLALAADQGWAGTGKFLEAAQDLSKSLVLLIPGTDRQVWDTRIGKTEWGFYVRCPAVDIRVWDRSFDFVDAAAGDTQRTREQRRRVWAETFALLDQPNPPEGSDVTLDDPVVRGITATLTRFGATTPGKLEHLTFQKWPGVTGIKAEQARPLSVKIKARAGGGATMEREPDGSGLVVEVPEGEVWKLELWATVPKDMAGLFQPQVWRTLKGEMLDDPVLAALRPFYLEVATKTMPEPAELYRALRTRSLPGGAPGNPREVWPDPGPRVDPVVSDNSMRTGWRIEAALDPTRVAGEAREKFQWVQRVHVMVQRWRWNGRPLRDSIALPADSSGTTSFTPQGLFRAADQAGADDPEQLITWDGRLFGDRPAADYRGHDAFVDFPDLVRPGMPKGAYRIFQQDVAGDPGALYFRFAVQVSSRYEGLLRSPPADSRGGRGDVEFDAWRRLIVRCRYDKEIPPPRLKLVLPLTDVREFSGDKTPGETTPGLLVVLSEPWFQYGGLAEELTVEVAAADDPVLPHTAQVPSRRSELGPDSLVTADAPVIVPPGDGLAGTGSSGWYSFDYLPAYGPLGHTFDLDTTSPLFVNTSFIVPAPSLVPLDPGTGRPRDDLSWYFIKLRFRRRIAKEGHVAPPEVSESEPTAPVWAQFLPPSSWYWRRRHNAADERVSVKDMRLRVRGAEPRRDWLIVNPMAPDEPLDLAPTKVPAEPERFLLFVLLTRRLYDALGHLNQEEFVAFRPLDKGLIRSVSFPDRAVMRARIVEAQVLPGSKMLSGNVDADLFTRYFFPDGSGAEAEARCTRMSGPIDMI